MDSYKGQYISINCTFKGDVRKANEKNELRVVMFAIQTY